MNRNRPQIPLEFESSDSYPDELGTENYVPSSQILFTRLYNKNKENLEPQLIYINLQLSSYLFQLSLKSVLM
jgi:hypothetical protein